MCLWLFLEKMFPYGSLWTIISLMSSDLDISPRNGQNGAGAPGCSADGAQRAAGVNWLHGNHRVARQERGKVCFTWIRNDSQVSESFHRLNIHLCCIYTLCRKVWTWSVSSILWLTLLSAPCQVLLHREGCRRFCADWDEIHQSRNLQDDTDPPGKQEKIIFCWLKEADWPIMVVIFLLLNTLLKKIGDYGMVKVCL